MNVWDIRKSAINEEIDYLFLKNVLKSYSSPRDKISQLLKNKDLIRVKKGIYVFGPSASQGPYCKETLANLIYGPSCISLEYALSYYGMIPERVEVVTSITTQRDKKFQTPIGTFSYRYIHPKKYPTGITQIRFDATHSVIMATPEKALADVIMLAKHNPFKWHAEEDVAYYLHEDLRISVRDILALNINRLTIIGSTYQNSNIDLLISYINQKRKQDA